MDDSDAANTNYDQMNYDQMNYDQMNYDQMNYGQMNYDQMNYGQMNYDQMNTNYDQAINSNHNNHHNSQNHHSPNHDNHNHQNNHNNHSKFGETFKELYYKRYDQHLKSLKNREEIGKLNKSIALLQKCIKEKRIQNESHHPIILGHAVYRISITNLGTFPPYKYTKDTIYPMNYTSKKKYAVHKNYTKGANRDQAMPTEVSAIGSNAPEVSAIGSNAPEVVNAMTTDVNAMTNEVSAIGSNAPGKLLYVCSIGENGPVIEAEDGFKWEGKNCWKEFVEDTEADNDYKSLEEFFGLAHPVAKKMIENLGDISQFKGYVPCEDPKDKK